MTEFVTVGCRLPLGLAIEVGLQTTVKDSKGELSVQVKRLPNYRRFVIAGTHEHQEHNRKDGIQVPSIRNPEPFFTKVPKDIWDEWIRTHGTDWVIRSKNIFAVKQDKDGSNVQAQTLEAMSTEAPFQPLDRDAPLKVGLDVVTAKNDKE